MLVVGFIIFAIHELVVRFFDLDEELLSSIAKWTFWTIAFCIAVFTPKKKILDRQSMLLGIFLYRPSLTIAFNRPIT